MEDYTLIRSRRRSLAIEITRDAQVILRAPMRMPKYEIAKFVEQKQDWIDEHLERAKERASKREAVSPEELKQLADEARRVLPERVAYYADIMGVTYGRIAIRNQKTRWGSCSAVGNLNFNCHLMQLPTEIQDYVVVHELAHRKEMNHSAAFWRVVEDVLPDYRERRKQLKELGHLG
ncbi:MAG: M48 family metallopeptidase [Lachnospiraceae bacterium]|nr:M48 family metallopeptidase [Lachnospiraceae bacterium]